MKRTLAILAALLPLIISAQTATWEATEAFSDKGLLRPMTSLDGLVWILDESGISISFHQADGAEYPDMATRPTASAWLYPGNELRICAPEGTKITGVTIHTLADNSFEPDGIDLSCGSSECSPGILRWSGETDRLAIGPTNTFASIYEPGARAAITDIIISYRTETEQSGITELRIAHSKSRLVVRDRHLHIIWRK